MDFTTRKVIGQFHNWCLDLSGLPVSDHGWWGGAIYDQFLASRATDILEEKIKDPTSPNKFVQQTIGCVLLEEARVEECPCAPPSGCTWYRTKLTIPIPIGDLISVTSIGGNLEHLEHFTYRDWVAIKYSLNARVEAERYRGYYCIRNNYLYVISKKKVNAVAISGTFYDPVEVQRTNCQGTDYCFPFLDYSLFIDPGKYQKLLASTRQLIGGMAGKLPHDTSNNGQPPQGLEPIRDSTIRN